MTNFGDIRSLVHERTTPERWELLCEALDTYQAPDLDAALAYIDEHLADEPRPIPEAWIERLLTGQGPDALRICRRLDLQEWDAEPAQLEHVWNTPGLCGLTHLDLSHAPLATAGLRALLEAPALRPTHLELWETWLGPEDIEALATHPSMARVQHLGLGNNDVGTRGLRALLGPARAVTALTSLYLSHDPLYAVHTEHGIEDADVTMLCALPGTKNLRRLAIDGAHITEQGALTLAGAESLKDLEHLGLHGCDLGVRGREALARFL